MRGKQYRVHLTKDKEKRLEEVVTKGVHPARQVRRAGILLLLNEGEDREGKAVKASEQSEAAAQCRCTMRVVYTVSKQYVKEGLQRVLNRKKRETPPVPAKAAGDIEAKIIARRCGETREPVPMNDHHGKREDNEYVRKGMCSVFMFVEPLGGKRYVCASR
jgi:hypothetical protein